MTPQDRFILVTGGARSGKSTFAERLAAQLAEPRGGRVTYLATSETNDDEMAARVAAHRAARPAAWTTVECPLEVPAAVREHAGGPAGPPVFLLDCVTFWVTNLLFADGAFGGSAPPEEGFNYDKDLLPADEERAAAARVSAGVDDLLAARRRDRRHAGRRHQRGRARGRPRVPARAPLPRPARLGQPAPGRRRRPGVLPRRRLPARRQGACRFPAPTVPREGVRPVTDLLTRTIAAITPLDADAMRAAEARQLQLTKPPKALGRLETLSIQLAGIQGKAQPVIESKAIAVMAADHGVTAEGVSAFPAEVTPGMVFNFAAGGAAINVIGRHVGARVLVTDVGVNADLSAAEGVRQKKVRMGTANMAQGAGDDARGGRARHRDRHRAGRGGAGQGPRHHRHRRDGHRQHDGRVGRHRGAHRRARRHASPAAAPASATRRCRPRSPSSRRRSP